MFAKFNKYGLHFNLGDEDDEFDNMPDETEEIIRDKLREHFK